MHSLHSLPCTLIASLALLAPLACAAPTEELSFRDRMINIDKGCNNNQVRTIQNAFNNANKILAHGQSSLSSDDPAFKRFMNPNGKTDVHEKVMERIAATDALTKDSKLTVSCEDEASEWCSGARTKTEDHELHLCPSFFHNSTPLTNAISEHLPCENSAEKSKHLSMFDNSARALLHEVLLQDTRIVDCYTGPYWSAHGAKYSAGAGSYNADSYAWMLMASYLNGQCDTRLDWYDEKVYEYNGNEQPMGIRMHEGDAYHLCTLDYAPTDSPFNQLPGGFTVPSQIKEVLVEEL